MRIEKADYRREFKDDFALAAKILGKPVEWSPHAYEAFRFESKNVKLIFYPHRTSAGHYHIRVRDGGSVDVSLARKLMVKLYEDSGFNRTFSCKNLPEVRS